MVKKQLWLDPTEIRSRVDSYDEATLDQSRQLLEKLVDADLRRAETVDSKAAICLGYAVAFVSFAFPRLSQSPVTGSVLEASGYAIGLIIALASGVFAYSALRGRAGWPGVPDESLLPLAGTREDPLKAKRYYLKLRHAYYREHVRVVGAKFSFLKKAQSLVLASLFAIALSSSAAFLWKGTDGSWLALPKDSSSSKMMNPPESSDEGSSSANGASLPCSSGSGFCGSGVDMLSAIVRTAGDRQ